MLKTKALIFLFIFVSFLVTPTLVCVVVDQVNIAYAFSLAEEENKTAKEVDLNNDIERSFLPIYEVSPISFFAHLNLAVKPVYLNLISPPPKW